jgi:hypothetical protein
MRDLRLDGIFNMEFKEPDFLSTFAFVLILIFVYFSFVAGIYFANREKTKSVAMGIFVWLLFISGVIQSHFVETMPVPRLFLFFAIINLVSLLFAFSSLGIKLSVGIPIYLLVGFQIFRLPLELVLHSWVSQGSIPSSMTWTGSNFDIVSGIVALIAMPISKKYLSAAWIANAIGFLLLLNVMRVAVLSSPVPFGWSVTPPLLLAFHLPYGLIVPVCVAGALVGHIILTRALLKR